VFKKAIPDAGVTFIEAICGARFWTVGLGLFGVLVDGLLELPHDPVAIRAIAAITRLIVARPPVG